jgi:hypothetical protein
VLSNTVISETTSSGNKESPESAILDHIPPANSTVPEKISVIQSTDEKTQLSTLENPKVTETVVAAEKDSKFDVNPEEPVVIVIQAAIRGFLVFSFSKLYESKTYWLAPVLPFIKNYLPGSDNADKT